MTLQEQFERDVMAKVAEKLAGVAIPKNLQGAAAQLAQRQHGSARETIIGALKGNSGTSGQVAPIPTAKPRPASKVTAEGLRDTNPLMN